MDLAKQGRVKVLVGDCVSLPTSCWGAAYQSNLKDNHDIEKVFGRVTQVTDIKMITNIFHHAVYTLYMMSVFAFDNKPGNIWQLVSI